MSLKTFKIIKIIIVVALAIAVSQAVVNKNYIIPMMAVAISVIVLLFFRGKVNEIIADERDYQIGGKAARVAMLVFSWIAVVLMLLLYAWKAQNPVFEVVAQTLSYSVCALLLLYSFIFGYYNKK